MEGDVSTDHFQDTNAAATTSGKGSISTVALAESTTGATTTTTARGKRSSAIVGFGATLNSLLLGGSPSPPPSSINAYQLQGQEGEGRWGTLVLCVRDEGAGISKDHQAMLFQEFVQFNATKLQAGGGSGLGLFICKRVVELHGGTIGVYSAGEGQGSSFTVELPMCRKQTASSLPASPYLRSINPRAKQPMPSAIVAGTDGNAICTTTGSLILSPLNSSTQRNVNHTNQLLLLSELDRKGLGSKSGLLLGLDQEQVTTSTLVYSTSWKKQQRPPEPPPLPPPQQQSPQQHLQQQQQQYQHQQHHQQHQQNGRSATNMSPEAERK